MDALLTNLFPVLGIPVVLFTTFLGILGFRMFLRNPRYRGFRQQDQDGPSVRPVSVFAFRALFFRYGLLSAIIMVGSILAWSLTTETTQVPDHEVGGLVDWEVVPPVIVQPPAIREVPLSPRPDVLSDVSPIVPDLQAVPPAEIRPVEDIIPNPATWESVPEPGLVPPPPLPVEDRIWKVAEDMPRFPGCEELGTTSEKEACAQRKLLEFLQDHVRYPELAKEVRLEGTVVASFVVEKDGSVSHIRIVRDIGAACGEEVLRVLRLMQDGAPHWSPGRQQGNPVRVEFHLPVRFRLQ